MKKKRSLFGHLLVGTFDRVNRSVPWHRLPKWFGVFNLLALRTQLRAENLHDTRTPGKAKLRPASEKLPPEVVRYRTPGGTYNDLSDPEMGMAGTRFARNVPLADAFPEPMSRLMEPNPREISRRLMHRDEFKPARTLNLLAAAWIQFQTHDWFNHARDKSTPIEIPIKDPGDDWFERPMRFARTMPDHTRCAEDEGLPPTYVNTESHWWDASAIYGSSLEKQKRVRSFEHGKLVLKGGRLPLDPHTGFALTGFAENWWIGLGMLHTLFTAEHNAICEMLEKAYPAWSDEQLFQTARLINSALMAKIHTVEWTPAITDHPVLHVAMRANWWGLAEEKLHRMFGRISKSEVISGIPGSAADHHGAPYQLTEEFVSVYRLHPLIPDEVEITSLEDGATLKVPFKDVALLNAEKVIREGVTAPDLWYSLGVQHPGAVCLHNFPKFLADITLPDGQRLDLAAVDIMRDRERGVPRYNQFRRVLHLKPAASFAELTENPVWARELEEVYGDVERVDLQVGMQAETPPSGFGFSDTAFRVFILMASRRLKSDRFLTSCYTAEYYTQEGLDWIAENDMRTVILRHYPEVAPALGGLKNAFAPWRRVSSPHTAPTEVKSSGATAVHS
jgi:hypothetical protein